MFLLRSYQYLISPLLSLSLTTGCRFYPSCSSYAIEAIQRHGTFYGCYLIFKRILRCHPWQTKNIDPIDPVPEQKR